MELSKIFDKTYYCCSNCNAETINELKENGFRNIEICKYTLTNKYYEYHNPKKILFYDVIKDAHKAKYNKIIILTDDIKFIGNNKTEFYLSKYSNNDMCIINPGDIIEDCFILSKSGIDKIYKYINKVNYTILHNQIAIEKFLSKSLSISKLPEIICAHKIDYVISYVNASDNVWYNDYKKYAANINSSYNKINRFRSFDILQYHLRGIYENINWVNNIYLIVSGPTQVPEWVSDKVHIIYHNQIIPNKYLPTFNSTTIEAFMHNIPNLSEYFIYANDDMFVTNKLSKSSFYREGKIVTSYNPTTMSTNYIQHCKNGYNIAASNFMLKKPFVVFNHTPHPFIKSTCYYIHKSLGNQIYQRISKFRDIRNFNQYIFLYHELLSDNIVKLPSSLYYTEITNKGISLSKENMLKHNFLCINDNALSLSDEGYEHVKTYLHNFLNEIYPFRSIYEVAKNTIIRNNEDIDYVFPYVTSDDEYWQKIYKKFLIENNGDINSWASGIERFRDNGLLKYVFRSIEKNMPWVHKVHMIVMRDSQVPKWINRDNVNIIYHDDFIPKKYLPLFNASTLEMFLPKIDVAENFVYSNDDLICFNAIPKEFFFTQNIPSYYLYIRPYKDSAPGDKVRRNSYITISNNTDNNVCSTQHGPVPYKLSWIRECHNKYKKELLNSISVFREDKNINQYVYAYYQAHDKTIFNEKKNIKDNTVSIKRLNVIQNMDFENYDFVCLNDNVTTTDKDWEIILAKIDKIFPNKSKYEL